ncbi:MAG: restriction endonuclease subunit S [Oscillospiraceae bacterium]|nr:restriction endonuclease subunit S [Oscillospiraceae bacterium]
MKWEKVRLADCCKSIADGDHQPPPKAENGVPFVTISNITSFNQFDFSNTMYVSQEYYDALDSKRKAQIGDVLYSVVGSFGIPVLIKENKPFSFQRHIAILRPNEKVLSAFLYYTMLSKDFYAKADAAAVGAAQRTISLSALRNIVIALPPLDKQRRVTDILSAYDEFIENNQKQIKLLEEAAQRLYKEWFVDLRFPGHENTPIMDGVPEGWRKETISDICDTIGGGTPSTSKSEYYSDGTIRWVTPTDLTKANSLILLDSEKKITIDGLNNSSAKLLPPYTILMTSRASIGYFALCEFEVCTNQGFISCVPCCAEMRYYLLFNLMERVDEIKGKATGSTFLEISKRAFRDMEIIVPNNELLLRFTTIIDPIIKEQRTLTKIIAHLQQARDRLLPKLMSGELEV